MIQNQNFPLANENRSRPSLFLNILEPWRLFSPRPALVFDMNGTPIWWQPFGGSISDITLESEIIFNRKELAITRLDGHL